MCEVPCHRTINAIPESFTPCPTEPLPTSKKLLSFGVYTSIMSTNAESLRLISEDAETPSSLVNPFFRVSYARPALIGLLFYTCRGPDSPFNDSSPPADDRNGQIRSELKSRIAKQSSGKGWIGSLDI
ncbi:hypothetical protein CDAR_448491 [Caerostris darwini]|uniref:Uncharacterized protein n=1 Tax=Caerostris darwini TaxID=1538125 RepID=A0AAV4QP75_9ARAC|nr:hypothetical protein CDAR_448491 [Caerostris darwini]